MIRAMLEQRIEQHFIDSADLHYQAAQGLSKPIAAAVQALMVCVTGDGKVLTCGNGGCAAAAAHFVAGFVGGFERPRPELAAVALASDGAVLTAISRQHAPQQVFARQVRALGQAGDVLLAISLDGNCANVVEAVLAAHEREMVVIGLTGHGGGRVGQLLRDTDVHVCVPHERPARVLETQVLALHCLCDAVDSQLLGDQEEAVS